MSRSSGFKGTGFKLAASEDELSVFVKDYSLLQGWRRIHHRAARKLNGDFYEPVEGDPGYPDWTLVRRGRLVVAELKSTTGRWRPGQQEWLEEMSHVPGCETYLWRPKDIPEIRRVLR